jgi:N-acetylglucosamine-6-phosphate deacetylase
MKLIQNGILFLPDGTLQRQDLLIENGRIKAFGDAFTQECEETVDAAGCIVAPGFVDIHIHGADGSDFSDGTEAAIDKIAGYLLTQGVTAFLGTTMSLGENELSGIMATAAPLIGRTRENKAVLWGINMEGPFLAMSKKGGQNGDYIIKPDFGMFERLYRTSGSGIRLLDLAPELEGSLEFIGKARKLCRISIAHTEADYIAAKKAFAKGATHVTHLFNAMPPVNHRNPGIIIAAMENADFVEVICDGNHIHPAMIRFAFKMFGRERICIVSDSMRACGLEDGEYTLGGQKVFVTEGRAVLKDGTLAGSTTSAAEGMRRAVRFGISLEAALQSVTVNPAKAAGLENILGSLKPGNRADIVLLNQGLEVKSVFLEGIRQ